MFPLIGVLGRPSGELWAHVGSPDQVMGRIWRLGDRLSTALLVKRVPQWRRLGLCQCKAPGCKDVWNVEYCPLKDLYCFTLDNNVWSHVNGVLGCCFRKSQSPVVKLFPPPCEVHSSESWSLRSLAKLSMKHIDCSRGPVQGHGIYWPNTGWKCVHDSTWFIGENIAKSFYWIYHI